MKPSKKFRKIVLYPRILAFATKAMKINVPLDFPLLLDHVVTLYHIPVLSLITTAPHILTCHCFIWLFWYLFQKKVTAIYPIFYCVFMLSCILLLVSVKKKPSYYSLIRLLRKATPQTDLPLILILPIYSDFLTLKFGKIQIFPPKIRRNTDFFFWNAKDFSLYCPYSYRFFS